MINRFKYSRHLQLQCFKANSRMDQLMTLLKLILLIFLEELMNLHLINKDLDFKLFRFKAVMIIHWIREVQNLLFKMKIIINIKKIRVINNYEIEIILINNHKKSQNKNIIRKHLSLNICRLNSEIKDIIFLDK